MNIRHITVLILLGALYALASSANAQPADTSDPNLLFVDFAVPDLSAQTLLGIADNKVARPGSLKDLSLALLQFVRGDGRSASSLALEGAPLTTVKGLHASAGVVTDSGSMRVALGIKWTFGNDTDPLADTALHRAVIRAVSSDDVTFLEERKRDFYAHLKSWVLRLGWGGADSVNAYVKINGIFDTVVKDTSCCCETYLLAQRVRKMLAPRLDTPDENAGLDSIMRAFAELRALKCSENSRMQIAGRAVRKLLDDFKTEHWNATAFHLVAGMTARSEDGSFDELQSENFIAYVGGSFGLGRNLQILFQVRGDWALREALQQESQYQFGARLLAGTNEWRGLAEYSVESTSLRNDAAAMMTHRVTAGTEFQISPGTWLEFAVGTSRDNAPGSRWTPVTLGTIRYAVNKGPKLGT